MIIPALNEEASLPLVLRDLPMTGPKSVGRVIVVDNGSTDATARVARENHATLIEQPQRGYGAACLRGLEFIEQAVSGGAVAPRLIVFLDGDYSDHGYLLPDLAAPILSGQQDFVLGSRILGIREPGAMPPQSMVGKYSGLFVDAALFWRKIYGLGTISGN